MEPNSIQVLLLGLLVDETLILDSNCKQDSGLLELNHRFQIPEFQIPDSRIPDSGFHRQKFLGFRNPHLALHWAKSYKMNLTVVASPLQLLKA